MLHWDKWFPGDQTDKADGETSTQLLVSKECYGRHLRKARTKLQP